MTSIVVIADDLTGANATGAQLVARGFHVETTLISSMSQPSFNGVEAKMISTDSRSCSPRDAYKTVYDVVVQLKNAGVSLLAKRVDSTLRGNCGAEVDAVLDAFADDGMAIIVPSFPAAGRIVVNGVLRVPGTPFDQTVVTDVFARQSRRHAAEVHLEDVQNKEVLKERLISLYADGVRLVVCDAAINNDINCLAETVLQLPFEVLPVDPGLFTSAVAAHSCVFLQKQKANQQVLALIGSIDPVVAEQVNRFVLERQPAVAMASTSKLLDSDASDEEIDRVVSLLQNSTNPYLVVTSDGLKSQYRKRLADVDKKLGGHGVAARRINASFGEIGKRLLEHNRSIAGLVTAGGDITSATYDKLGVYGLTLKGEVVPLGAFGYLKGGVCDGLAVITKGGMVGDDYSIVSCMDYLLLHTINNGQVRT